MDAFYGLTPGIAILYGISILLIGYLGWEILKFLFYVLTFKGKKKIKK